MGLAGFLVDATFLAGAIALAGWKGAVCWVAGNLVGYVQGLLEDRRLRISRRRAL